MTASVLDHNLIEKIWDDSSPPCEMYRRCKNHQRCMTPSVARIQVKCRCGSFWRFVCQECLEKTRSGEATCNRCNQPALIVT